ncbi:VanZ family protein [Gaopeijia maritima]|uniref:VanZ family protein n=1 Tax=Gaopeijia maritima TaxID=3119007 RepID=UPI0032890F4C
MTPEPPAAPVSPEGTPVAPPPPPPERRRRVVRWLVAWLLGVALLTLTPGGGGPAIGVLCFPCGELGAADAVLNTGLFVPLGALLGMLGAGVGTVAAAGFGLSAAIELTQTALPGRFPTVADVVVNGGGALLGLLLLRFVRAGRLTPVAVALAAAAALVVTAGLGAGTAPAGPLYGQHTPTLGSFAVYDGAVLRAEVGGVVVRPGRLDAPEPLREALRASGPLRVEFIAGTPTDRWAPIFAVFSEAREEAVFLAARDDDLIVRFRSWAGRLHFAEPSFVLEGGLAGVQPGDVVSVEARRGRTGFCVRTEVAAACGLDPSPVEGWRLLYRDIHAPGPFPLFTGFYVAVVVGLLMVTGGVRTAAIATGGLVALAFALSLATSAAWPEPVGLVGGALVGAVVSRLGRRWRVADTRV